MGKVRTKKTISDKLYGLLFDKSPLTNKKVPVEVEINNGSIYIKPKGYGDCASINGNGCPIMVEIWEGELRVVAWTDINNENADEVIGLEGAREKLRAKI